jgi:hypothetical protein
VSNFPSRTSLPGFRVGLSEDLPGFRVGLGEGLPGFRVGPSEDEPAFGNTLQAMALQTRVDPAGMAYNAYSGIYPASYSAADPGTTQASPLPPPGIPTSDGSRNQCIERCTDLILMVPPAKRPGTFDQCMAHCEGRGYFQPIQPYIPFPFGGN